MSGGHHPGRGKRPVRGAGRRLSGGKARPVLTDSDAGRAGTRKPGTAALRNFGEVPDARAQRNLSISYERLGT